MDPDHNLKTQLELAGMILDTLDQSDEDGNLDDDQKEGIVGDAQHLAELVQALHGWIAGGGFLPRDWARGR